MDEGWQVGDIVMAPSSSFLHTEPGPIFRSIVIGKVDRIESWRRPNVIDLRIKADWLSDGYPIAMWCDASRCVRNPSDDVIVAALLS